MPPVIIIVIGAAGAFAAGKWMAREFRRINAELHPESGAGMDDEPGEPIRATLRRDPKTGVYRPDR